MRKIIAVFLALASIVITQPLFADDKEWTGGANSTIWSDDGNWDPSGVPTANDSAFIRNGATVDYDYNYASGDNLDRFVIDQDSTFVQDSDTTIMVANQTIIGDTGTGTYNLNQGILAAGNEFVGNYGIGTFNQSGGTNYVGFDEYGGDMPSGSLYELIVGRFAGSSGEYNLSAGQLYAVREIVGDAGGFGIFNQSGVSEHEVGNNLIVGQNTYSSSPVGGAFNLSESASLYVGGNVYVGDEGGTGAFVLQGNGDFYVNRDLVIGANSENGSPAQQSSGTFTQDGGTSRILGIISLGQVTNTTGTYELKSGSLSVDSWTTVGEKGNGNFNQTGGTFGLFDDYSSLYIASDSGSIGAYTLGNNAELYTDYTEIAGNGAGTFFQSGASLHEVANDLNLAQWENGVGTYHMDGGGLNVNRDANVGINGEGLFEQTGGDVNVADTLYVGGYPGSHGTYDMSGGTLQASNILIRDQSKFNVHDTGTAGNPQVIDGNIENSGEFKFYHSIVKAENNFEVKPTGYVVGILPIPPEADGVGSKLIVGGDFINRSGQESLWNTANAQLEFTNAQHYAVFNGVDLGAVQAGYVNNFYWGDVSFGNGQILLGTLDGQKGAEGIAWGALYTGTVGGMDLTQDTDNNIFTVNNIQGGSNIYYQADANPWLLSKTYNLASGGGQLRPVGVVPEPISSVLFLLGAGVFGAAARKRRRA